MVESKTCTSCRAEKPTSSFDAASARKDGLHPYCKDCRRSKRRAKLGRPLRKKPPAYRDAAGKICPRCSIYKPWDGYYVCKSAGDGRKPYCKTCMSEISRARWQERGAELSAIDKARCAATPLMTPDPDILKRCAACRVEKPQTEFNPRRGRGDGFEARCKSCKKAAHAVWLQENPDYWRRNKLQRHYGLTPEQYDALLERQGGRCAICVGEGPGRKGSDFFAVDHDHDTGMIRGLLCSTCNMGLGSFKDDPTRLSKAIEYLVSPPARGITA